MRELIAQLMDAGKAYTRAEIAYLKQLVTVRASAAAVGIGFAVVALLFIQAAIVLLLAAVGLALARWLGIAGGLAVGALVGLLAAGLLGWLGLKRISAAGSAS